MFELRQLLRVLPLFLSLDSVCAQTRDNCPTSETACNCYGNSIICADLGHREVLPTFQPSTRTFLSLSFRDDSCRILGVQSRAFVGLRVRSIDLSCLGLGSLHRDAFSGADARFVGRISLAHNRLEEISSSAFAGLTSLTLLDLRNNYITQLRRDVFSVLGSSLRTLLLTENLLGTNGLERGVLSGLGQLRRLEIEDNQLTRWSSCMLVGTASISDLSLAGNRLTALPKGSFDGLRQLTNLRLSRNDIAVLAGGTFRHLTSLRELDVSRNRLKRLNETVFEGLRSLMTLNLSTNELTELPMNVLLPLTGLQSLDLSQNLIRQIPGGLFANQTTLVKLYFSGNNLTITNKTLRGLTALTELYLSSNSICTISGSLFADLSRLRLLDLSDNKIIHMDAGFLSFSSALEAVNLSGNKLSEIEPNVFRNGPKLTTIDLSWNAIRRINRDTFYNLLLTRIDLSHNELEFIHPDAFRHIASLSTITLNHNHFHHVPSTLLYNIAVLQNVDLDHNLIETLPARAFEGLYVDTVSVTGNKIRLVDEAAFAGLLKCRSINLSNNRIEHIFNNTFNHSALSSVSHLYLSDNNLTQLTSEAFSGLPGLVFLDLSNNGIHTVANGAFSELQQLWELRLGGNHLESTRHSWIGDIRSLRTLNISSNGLGNQALRALQGASGLTELYLDSNNLTSLAMLSGTTSLQVLSVRNNSLASVDFSYGFSVSVLDLGHNQLRGSSLTFGLQNYHNLETLALDGNTLEVLTSNVFSPFASRLKELDLSDNRLNSTSLAALTGLVNIHALTLDDNDLQDISSLGQTAVATVLHKISVRRNRLNSTVLSLLSNFTKLNTLHLDGNNIDVIPDRTFGSSYNVQVVSLSGNIIRNMSADALYGLQHTCQHLNLSGNSISLITRQTFSSLRTLEHLDLSNNNLTSVNLSPLMPKLRVLRLGGNRLGTFPEGLQRFSQISILNVSHNFLTSLPAVAIFGHSSDRVAAVDFQGNSLLNLGELRLVGSFGRVDFRSNNLTDLSPKAATKRVKYADELDLSRNSITAMSPAIWQTAFSVSSLNISKNNLTLLSMSNSLAAEDEQYGTILTKLDLSFNSLSEFRSGQIASLSGSLSVLDIRNNRFESLPQSEFINTAKLTHLFMADNLWNCSSCDLLWIRQLQSESGVIVDEAKCMFPGNIHDHLVECFIPPEICQSNYSMNDSRCHGATPIGLTTASPSTRFTATQPRRTVDKTTASVNTSETLNLTTSAPFVSSVSGTSLLASYGVTTNNSRSTPHKSATTPNQDTKTFTKPRSLRVTTTSPSTKGILTLTTAGLTITALRPELEKSTVASTTSGKVQTLNITSFTVTSHSISTSRGTSTSTPSTSTRYSTSDASSTFSRVSSSTNAQTTTARTTPASAVSDVTYVITDKTLRTTTSSPVSHFTTSTSGSSVLTTVQSPTTVSTHLPNTTLKLTPTPSSSLMTSAVPIPTTTRPQLFISSTVATSRITPGLLTRLPTTPAPRWTSKPTPGLNDAIKKAKGIKETKEHA